MKHKTVNDLICKTTSKTFQAYWREMRRHEDALRKIYAKDKLHKHIPESTGSMSQVHPQRRLIVNFYRCAVCMKDLTEAEVEKLKRKP